VALQQICYNKYVKRVNGVPVFDGLDEILDPRHTALLVVDVQNDMCRPDGWMAQAGRDVSAILAAVPGMARLAAAARECGVTVVLIEQTTLPDNASDSPAWLYFKTRDGRRRTDYTLDGSWGQQTLEEIGPGDLVVRKHRPSAFHATQLDLLLRARGVRSVAVCGTITQGCVQATVMDASFHDYYVVVAGDAVQSFSAALHENALTFLRSRYDVADSAEIVASWRRQAIGGAAA
jgi:nicotinamidase-related amidase